MLLSKASAVGFAVAFLPMLVVNPWSTSYEGVCDGYVDCMGILVFAGVPGAIAAILVVNRWKSLASFGLGFWIGAAASGSLLLVVGWAEMTSYSFHEIVLMLAFGSPLFAALTIGGLGVPIFAVLAVIRWVRRRLADHRQTAG